MTKAEGSAELRALLLRLLDEGYDQPAWHGPNLKSALRRVVPEQAVWRPGKGRRSIAEIALHCAYWKYAVRRRISGGKRGSFPLKGSDWFDVPSKLTKAQWRGYLELLDGEHKALREAIATTATSRLVPGRAGWREPQAHVHGAALHDIYHAGQIRTIKALMGKSKRSG